MAGPREKWNSRLGFIMATVGSAIGLGNIWRFPTAVGQSGGGVFLFIYLLIILIIGIPLMIGELTIGRRGQSNIVNVFKKIKPTRPWWLIGVLGVVTGLIILSFYSVIAGWSLSYIYKFSSGLFRTAEAAQAEEIFSSFVSHPWLPLFWQMLFIILTAAIVIKGIRRGIEKASTTLMPLMFILLFLLLFRSLTLEGAVTGLWWFLKPDLSAVNLGIILGALGQVFFSLSLGMGAIITYGSYLSRDDNIPESSFIISSLDLGIAVLAGLIIIPAVFAFDLEPGTGPPLIFITLPLVFAAIPAGDLFGALFFLLLSIAALTSAISILEVVVATFKDIFQQTRKKSSVIAAFLVFLLGVPSSLSMGILDDFLLLGFPFLEFVDFLSAIILLPLIGLLTALFLGWVWTPEKSLVEIEQHGVRFKLWKPWSVILKYILPLALAYILISGIAA